MPNQSNAVTANALVSRSNLSVDTVTMKRLTRSENLPTGGYFLPIGRRKSCLENPPHWIRQQVCGKAWKRRLRFRFALLLFLTSFLVSFLKFSEVGCKLLFICWTAHVMANHLKGSLGCLAACPEIGRDPQDTVTAGSSGGSFVFRSSCLV